MRINGNLDEALSILGLESADTQQSRIVDILKTVLNLQLELGQPLSFAEILTAVNKPQGKSEITRAWLHRLLKLLVEKGLVQIETETTSHRKYVCDINSLIFGVRKMSSNAIEDLTNKIQETESKIKKLKAINTNTVAAQLFETLTGRAEIPGSRYLRGLDEFHQVTDETIYQIAKKGDIIRSSVIDVASFLSRVDERMDRIFATTATGADIRYAVSLDFFQIKQELIDERMMAWGIEFFGNVLKYQGKGLDARILSPGVKRYQFVSLNHDVMALMITDNPVTAAWVTQSFNSELIQGAIDSFEKEWEAAVPIDKLNAESLSQLGVPMDNFIVSLLEKASKMNRSS